MPRTVPAHHSIWWPLSSMEAGWHAGNSLRPVSISISAIADGAVNADSRCRTLAGAASGIDVAWVGGGIGLPRENGHPSSGLLSLRRMAAMPRIRHGPGEVVDALRQVDARLSHSCFVRGYFDLDGEVIVGGR